MSERKDDGTFGGGFVMALAAIACLFAGYWVRDQGITFRVNIPTEVRR